MLNLMTLPVGVHLIYISYSPRFHQGLFTLMPFAKKKLIISQNASKILNLMTLT